MAISEKKTRILVTITKEQKEKLYQLATNDNRSISNLCAKILTDYLNRIDGGEIVI